LSLLVFSCSPSIVRFLLAPFEDDCDFVERLSMLPLLFDDAIELASEVVTDVIPCEGLPWGGNGGGTPWYTIWGGGYGTP
jgi:hypothetical protein